MEKYVNVIDCVPSANKKGLRIKVKTVELDENNNVLALRFEFSGWRIRGIARLEVSENWKIKLPQE